MFKFRLTTLRLFCRYAYCLPMLILAWLIAHLPYRFLLRIGKGLGWLLYRYPTSMQRIARINIAQCFPELSRAEQDDLLKKNLNSTAIGMMELLLCWFGNCRNKQQLLELSPHYKEQVQTALKQGRGIILLCPHLTSLHIVGALFAQRQAFDVVYNKIKHPLFEYINRRHLERYYANAYPREKIRTAIKALKQNHILFYTPDIDPVKHGGVFAPFFGIEAYTLTAPAKIAALTGATVYPCYFFRQKQGGYFSYASQSLNALLTGDTKNDAIIMNQAIEHIIRQHPEQYLWCYKRFKTRPSHEQSFYH